jgi:thiol-disulfide isomerase/thioredoxin
MKRYLPAIILMVAALHASGKDAESKHKLSDWKIGEVLFGDKPTDSSMRGKVVVIENWGVKCPPCIAMLPHLADLDKRNREKGLLIIGAESQGHSKEDIEPLLKKAKVNYTVTSGANGPIEVNGIPHAFVFDVNGALVFNGHPADEEFDRSIKKALREVSKEEEAPAAPAGPLVETSTWTNSEGKEIRAAVKSADSTQVVFLMTGGKEVKYPLEKLSADSRGKIEEALAASKKTAEDEEE